MTTDKAFLNAVKKLYQWQYGQRDENDFTFKLYSLFQSANTADFEKLAASFPTEAEAYRLWNKSQDPVEFFKLHGAWKGPRS